MNVTEVMAALNTVEQDHRLVLDRMQALKETVNCLTDRKIEDVRQMLLQLREINNYFATDFTCHLEEEEETLFPLLEQYSTEATGVMLRLRPEHETIRRRCEEFDNGLQVALDLEDGLNKTVLRDVFLYGWRMWELLDDHAHLETQAIHRCLEISLHNGAAAIRK